MPLYFLWIVEIPSMPLRVNQDHPEVLGMVCSYPLKSYDTFNSHLGLSDQASSFPTYFYIVHKKFLLLNFDFSQDFIISL